MASPVADAPAPVALHTPSRATTSVKQLRAWPDWFSLSVLLNWVSDTDGGSVLTGLSFFGCKNVECFRWPILHPTIWQKLCLGHDIAMCPARRQLSHSPLLRTKLIRSSTDFPLNSWQRDSQWLSLHNGHLTFDLFGTCPVLLLGGSVVPSGVVPCVMKAEPLYSFNGVLCLLLEPVPTALFLSSCEWMFPNTGWLAILAFASTNSAISSIVTSLFRSSVMWSAFSLHLCLSQSGNLPMIFWRVSGFSILFRYPISFREFLQLVSRTEYLCKAGPSSDLIWGVFVTRSMKAVAIL